MRSKGNCLTVFDLLVQKGMSGRGLSPLGS